MTNLQIINKVVNLLKGQSDSSASSYSSSTISYTVINGFNNEEEVNLDGVVAVNITSVDNLYHGNSKDCKKTMTINGQTFISEDLNQSRINKIYDEVNSRLDSDWFADNIDGLAGVLFPSSSISSDGETNNFSIVIELYICED